VRAVVYKGPSQLAVEMIADPAIEEPTDAIVRVTMSAICGTDVRLYTGRLHQTPGPSLGHEFVGVVDAIGADVRRIQAGQRVVSVASVFCGGCFYCKQGLLSACENRRTFGRDKLGGGQAELVRVPRADAILEPLPPEVSDASAVFLADLLPGPFAGLEIAGMKAGDTVAVVGCGPTGLATQLVAQAMGAGRVLALDHHDYRRRAADALGATSVDGGDPAAAVRDLTGGRGADLAVEATGTVSGLTQALALCRPWGTALSLGIGFDGGEIPSAALTDRSVFLVPARPAPARNYLTAVMRMIAHGVIDPAPLASHTLPRAEAPRGYEIMANRSDGALKVLIRP